MTGRMLSDIDRERAEAVFALVFVSAAVGAGIGLSAAGPDSLPVPVEMLGLAGFTVVILVGPLTERLLAADTVPGLGIEVDAPDNATTGFYAAGAVLMALGLVVELATASFDPLVVLLYLACGTLALARGFRRGTGTETGTGS